MTADVSAIAARLGDLLEAGSRLLRRDPLRIPGSLHYASGLAYGDFVLADGPTVRCEAVRGISGVVTHQEVRSLGDGRPEVQLRRVLTHFDFDRPSVLIEQHPVKPSVGTLTGAAMGDVSALLPGKASFSQYLILTLDGRPLANREPLVMTADRVDQWPPIGSTFVSEAPTHFYDLDQVDSPDAPMVATLDACKQTVIAEVAIPIR
jgi:hypothetical protein